VSDEHLSIMLILGQTYFSKKTINCSHSFHCSLPCYPLETKSTHCIYVLVEKCRHWQNTT